MEKVIDDLYEEVAAFYGMTVRQLIDDTTKTGKLRFLKYYEHKHNWDSKTENPPF